MTLKQLIDQLTAIMVAFRGAQDWQVVALDGPAGSDDFYTFSHVEPRPELDEVRLT